jgi:hypothetical protein
VYCLDKLTVTGGVPIDFDLLAGSVTDQAGGALPRVDRLRAFGKDDQLGWHAEFSHDGTQFAYSTVTAAADLATVRAVPTPGLGTATPTTVVEEVRSWALTMDGQKIYYRNRVTGGTGTLVLANFPAGSGPVTVADKVSSFFLFGGEAASEKGVGFFADIGSGTFDFRVVRDRSMPSKAVTVFNDMNGLEDLHVSNDGRFSGYVNGAYETRIAPNDKATPGEGAKVGKKLMHK